MVNAFVVRETFLALYDGGTDTAGLLIDSDEQFFGLAYLVFLDAVCLSLTRPLDPAYSNGNENLTLELLLNHTELRGAPGHANWEKELNGIRDAAKNLLKLRNKVIAHSDLAHFTVRDAAEHPGFSRAEAEEVLDRMFKLMNACRVHLGMDHMNYEMVFEFRYARQLLSRLEVAREHFLDVMPKTISPEFPK